MATWKQTHSNTRFEERYDDILESDLVVSGIVYGLADTSDQLDAAKDTAVAAVGTSHPDIPEIPLYAARAEWLRGDTGDSDGAIARVLLVYRVSDTGVISGGTMTYAAQAGNVTITVKNGTLLQGAIGKVESKGPGDADEITYYGVSAFASFKIRGTIPDLSDIRLKPGAAGSTTFTYSNSFVGPNGVCVIDAIRHLSGGLAEVEGTWRQIY